MSENRTASTNFGVWQPEPRPDKEPAPIMITVLLVDSEPRTARTLQNKLSANGYEC